MTHDKNLHIAPLLLTRFAHFLSSETRERKRWPALCLIHSPNETLFLPQWRKYSQYAFTF
ncbi:hypothetical protein CYQ92_06965 [Escherichia coli]|nr:hypothetical protein CYQ92_06965 [Escherichia coli]